MRKSNGDRPGQLALCVLRVPTGAQTGSSVSEQMGVAERNNPNKKHNKKQNKKNNFAHAFGESRGKKECPLLLLDP